MADICSVIVTGRLSRDAQLKYSSNGIPAVRGTVACNKSRKRGDQWVTEGHFFDFIYWGNTAEKLTQYLAKGKDVVIKGELNQNRWEQDGQARSKVEILVEEIKLGRDSGQNRNSPYNLKQDPNDYPHDDSGVPPGMPDDIPF